MFGRGILQHSTIDYCASNLCPRHSYRTENSARVEKVKLVQTGKIEYIIIPNSDIDSHSPSVWFKEEPYV